MICKTDRLIACLCLVALFGLTSFARAQDAGQADVTRAIEQLTAGDGLGAQASLRSAQEAGAPRDAIAARMGEALLLQGDGAGAREWLGPGRFSPDTRGHGFRMLGRLEAADGNLKKAGEAYDKALQSIPRDAGLWIDIARLRYRGGEHAQALAAVERALSFDGDHPGALQFRGQFARDAQGLAAALPWFERALDQAPSDLELKAEYAATLGDLGRYRDMLQVVREIAKVDRKFPRIHYLQAVLAARAGKTMLAKRLLNRTRGVYDDLPAAIMLAAVIDLSEGNPRLAVEGLAPLAVRQPDNRRVQELYARALLEAGDLAELTGKYADLARRADASPYLLTVVGRAFEAQGEREKAAPLLDRAGRAPGAAVVPLPAAGSVSFTERRWIAEPEDLANAIALIRALMNERRVGQARIVAMEAIRANPGSIDSRMVAGDVLLAAGETKGALAQYERASRLRFTYALLEKMVRAELALGRIDRAQNLTARFVARNPNMREARLLLADLELGLKDWGGAAAAISAARRLPGGGDDPYAASRRALALIEAREAPQALAEIRRAYRQQPASEAASYAYAQSLRLAGKQAAAKQLQRKARDLATAGITAR